MKQPTKAVVFRSFMLLALAWIGCENDSQPLDNPPVVMHLEIQRTDNGMVASATVHNQGFYPVKYWSGCGCDIGLWVEDDHGNRLHLYCGPEPACACREVNLSPGETKLEQILFRGLMCVGGELGIMEPVEPGQYGIVASFSYSGPTNNGVFQNIQDRRDFTWPEVRER